MTCVRIYIEPVPAARPRVTMHGTYTPAKYARFKKEAQLFLKKAFTGSPLEGALSVDIHFAVKKPKSVTRKFPTVRPDLDNFQKAILDAGNLILWLDDCQIIKLSAEKSYTQDNPYIELKIQKVEE